MLGLDRRDLDHRLPQIALQVAQAALFVERFGNRPQDLGQPGLGHPMPAPDVRFPLGLRGEFRHLQPLSHE